MFTKLIQTQKSYIYLTKIITFRNITKETKDKIPKKFY